MLTEQSLILTTRRCIEILSGMKWFNRLRTLVNNIRLLTSDLL